MLGGIVAQGDEIRQHATAAGGQVEAWLKDAGVDSDGACERVGRAVKSDVPEMISTL